MGVVVVRRRMRTLSCGIVIILGLGACGQGDLLGPEENPGPPVMIQDAVPLSFLFQDVRDRIVPSLPEQPGRGELAAANRHLVTTLEAGSLPPVKQAFAAAYLAARRYADQLQDRSAEADLAALWLAMDILTQTLRESGE